MTFESFLLKTLSSRYDRKRDEAIPLPEGITECRNISYSYYGSYSLLDVYYPTGTTHPIPTIVSIHGGGYVHGSKESYRRYGMDMAKRGFAFVNFNYRLAPKWRFPTPLADTNAVLNWVVANAVRYHLDPQNIILIGDSAGAQIASQYAAIFTNPQYAALFDLSLPQIRIKAVGLSCGMYDLHAEASKLPRKGIYLEYLGKELLPSDPRFRVLENITESYPPTFIATSCNEFLRPNAGPMYEFLSGKGIPCSWKCYGTPDNKEVSHVFHVNILLPEAVQCNDDQCVFFRQYI